MILGGVTLRSDNSIAEQEHVAYSYDCDTKQWHTLTLPSQSYPSRQAAACAVTSSGIAYIWGGKRADTEAPEKQQTPVDMYRFNSILSSNSSRVMATGLQPPFRYAHKQTMLRNHLIVVLGGFDGLTGNPVSMTDIWIFDTVTSVWASVKATLDSDNRPENRSSHSQTLMPDGVSILMQVSLVCEQIIIIKTNCGGYGGYDGYHVYNDVSVLDTRTWTWTVKNTNAAVQGRADHTGKEQG
ncbi:hypothetical protein BDF14DRAFT_1876167 [Spinellus fusiger]|nr:hypothetical protein BDF14DRAFT_1876167 [Spinellus fusiger]